MRILLIEDSAGDSRLIQGMLAEAKPGRFDLECTDRLSIGLMHLTAGGIDLILLDLGLPDSQGVDTLLRTKARAPEVPIIVLTGVDDEELAVNALRQGAQDYLMKGQTDGSLLARAIRYAIERKRAEQTLKEYSERLEGLVLQRTKDRRDLQALSAQLIDAQEAERERLSQMLHESLGQALAAISINLAAIEAELPTGLVPVTREKLVETSSLVEQMVGTVRELSLDLRPTMLNDLGLVPTLRWYVSRYRRRTGIEVELEAISLPERLAATVETGLYRVLQEALTNIAKHAQANKVRVRLEQQDCAICALIEDDGIGFDLHGMAARDPLERGAGLLTMRERMASLAGRLNIDSRPGQGTRLSLEIPLAQGEER